MRGRARNARLVGQMVYNGWFRSENWKIWTKKMIFLLKIDGGIGKILKNVNKCLNRC